MRREIVEKALTENPLKGRLAGANGFMKLSKGTPKKSGWQEQGGGPLRLRVIRAEHLAHGRVAKPTVGCDRKNSESAKGTQQALQRGWVRTGIACELGNALGTGSEQVSNTQLGRGVHRLRRDYARPDVLHWLSHSFALFPIKIDQQLCTCKARTISSADLSVIKTSCTRKMNDLEAVLLRAFR
jgi:hypothetical protein